MSGYRIHCLQHSDLGGEIHLPAWAASRGHSWSSSIVPAAALLPEPGEVDAWCRERLPGYLRPRRLRRVLALPLTGSGKLDRARLRELMAAEGVSEG